MNLDRHRPFANLKSRRRVFAFLDLEHPAVAWAVMRGMLVSAAHTAAEPGFVSFMQAGMILAGNNTRIFNEAVIELWRGKFYPDCISRMRGIYFFETRSAAEARIGDHDWPSYFIAENLIEFELLTNGPITKADANWITFANLDATGRITLKELDWISQYWQGVPRCGEPTWEILANGVALVLDEAKRRNSETYLKELFPRSYIPMLMARIASEVGTRGGQIHPFLLRADDETVRLVYLSSDAEFHDLEIIKAMKTHPDSSLLGRLMSENETWNAPDLRPWERIYKLGRRPIPGLGDFQIASVHDNNPR